MEFNKYSSLVNHDNQYINDILSMEETSKCGPYRVMEKIHGSNFSLFDQDSQVVAGRRNGFLNIGDSFHKFQSLMPEYEPKAQKIFTRWPNAVIYGELFGCYYGNMPVAKGFSKLQKSIHYTPNLELVVYEIYDRTNEKYINTSVAHQALSDAGFKVSPVLATYETLTEALKHSAEFKSTIPDFLGLPEFEGDNWAEGIVIKPEIDFYYEHQRVVVKKKHPKFKENDSFPRKNRKNNSIRDRQAFLDAYVNENRLQAVRSKELETITRDELVTLLIRDIFTDLVKDGIEIKDENRISYEKHITKCAGRYLWKMFPNSKK